MSSETGYSSSTHYMIYRTIRPEERRNLAESIKADYAADSALEKVKPGDVLWLVNVYLGDLLLLGRLGVEVVVDNIDIAQQLVDPVPGTWQEADWYAIANPYRIESTREVVITHLAERLRFHSKHDRLEVIDGVDARQLAPLRRLTGDSAKLLEEIWYSEEYTPEAIEDYLELSEDDHAYAEGRTVIRTMKERQRSRALVTHAKAQFIKKHGRLFCEICSFDFMAFYGMEYIEAHHLQQIASLEGEVLSTSDDLVMVCANCHRMAHQRTPPYSPDELRAMINQRQNPLRVVAENHDVGYGSKNKKY
ncbi:MAG: HNH endonuclease [Aggregatilineales bacterium]